MGLEHNLSQEITGGYIVSMLLIVAARQANPYGRRRSLMVAVELGLWILLGLVVVGADFSLFVLDLQDMPALTNLLTTAQIPLLLVMLAYVLVNMTRLIWVFAKRERVPQPPQLSRLILQAAPAKLPQ